MMKNSLILILFLTSAAEIFAFEIDLETAERLAVEASDDIITAREQIQLALLQNKINIRSFLPEVDFSYSDNRQTNMHSADSELIRLGLSIKQPLFNGGRNLENLRLAEVQIKMQTAALENSIEDLRDRVWEMFFGLLLNEQKKKLQLELLDITERQYLVSEKKYSIGALTELDLIEAAIEIKSMQLDIMDTETETAGLIRDFAILLGFDETFADRNSLELIGSLDRNYHGMQLWANDHSVWEQIAVSGNHELKEKRVELLQANTQHELSKTAFLPSIFIEASLFMSGSDFPLQEPGGTISLKAEFPFNQAPSSINAAGGFSSKDRKSSSGDAEIAMLPSLSYIVQNRTIMLQLKTAAQALENTQEALSRSISTSLKKLENSRQRLTIQRSTQDLQKRRLSILETRNSLGEITEAELQEARVEFYSEEIGIIEGVLELMKAERAFEKLSGAGFGELKILSDSIYYHHEIPEKAIEQ